MIYKIIENKYPNATLITLEGGYTNRTVMIKDINLSLVAKIYSEHGNAPSEVKALTMLKNLSITPCIYESFEHDSSWCVIMDYLPGTVGQRYLDNNDMVKSYDIYKQLGIHLANDIHSICLDNSVALPVLELVSPNIDSIVPKNLLNETMSALDVNFPDIISLVHGDFGPQNIIINQRDIKIVDWEFAAWGNPIYDIAWVVWFVHLHYPYLCKELSKIFLNEYLTYANIKIDQALIKAFAVSRVVFILSLISKDNIESRTEWIRRLTWTLKTDFTV